MLKTTTQKTINGTSVMEESGMQVATMCASVYEDGRVSITKNICDAERYLANKQEVQKDFEDFEKMVMAN